MAIFLICPNKMIISVINIRRIKYNQRSRGSFCPRQDTSIPNKMLARITEHRYFEITDSSDFFLPPPIYLSPRVDTHERTIVSVSLCESNPLYGMRQHGARQPHARTQYQVSRRSIPAATTLRGTKATTLGPRLT